MKGTCGGAKLQGNTEARRPLGRQGGYYTGCHSTVDTLVTVRVELGRGAKATLAATEMHVNHSGGKTHEIFIWSVLGI